ERPWAQVLADVDHCDAGRRDAVFAHEDEVRVPGAVRIDPLDVDDAPTRLCAVAELGRTRHALNGPDPLRSLLAIRRLGPLRLGPANTLGLIAAATGQRKQRRRPANHHSSTQHAR